MILFFLYFSFLIVLFFCHVNLVVIYKNGFEIYYKILFVKIKLFPFKEDKRKSTLDGVREAKNALDRLKRYRDLSKKVFGFYYRALRFKIINLDVVIASKAPSYTALYYSFTVQAISYFLKSVEKNLILQIPKESRVNIRADFTGEKSHFRTHFVIYTYLGPLVAVGILSFFKMIFSFLRRILNGKFKAKRVD